MRFQAGRSKCLAVYPRTNRHSGPGHGAKRRGEIWERNSSTHCISLFPDFSLPAKPRISGFPAFLKFPCSNKQTCTITPVTSKRTACASPREWSSRGLSMLFGVPFLFNLGIRRTALGCTTRHRGHNSQAKAHFWSATKKLLSDHSRKIEKTVFFHKLKWPNYPKTEMTKLSTNWNDQIIQILKWQNHLETEMTKSPILPILISLPGTASVLISQAVSENHPAVMHITFKFRALSASNVTLTPAFSL